jgi:membrane associated rhomboid family serine protease
VLEVRHGGGFFAGPTRGVEVHYGAVPHEFTHPGAHTRWGTLLTSMFVHGSFLHIFGNMLFLAIFGPTVESTLGRLRFSLFYLLGGLVALGAQIAGDPSSGAPALGSSGAVAAVLGGYILLYPRARILTLVLIVFLATIVEVPAIVLLTVWFIEQVYLWVQGLAGSAGGDEAVAYLAQVGAFAFGLLTIRLLATRRTRASQPVY